MYSKDYCQHLNQHLPSTLMRSVGFNHRYPISRNQIKAQTTFFKKQRSVKLMIPLYFYHYQNTPQTTGNFNFVFYDYLLFTWFPFSVCLQKLTPFIHLIFRQLTHWPILRIQTQAVRIGKFSFECRRNVMPYYFSFALLRYVLVTLEVPLFKPVRFKT